MAQTDPDIEVQVVRSLDGLERHLTRLHPDSLVLDLQSTDDRELSDLFAAGSFGRLPTIVLADEVPTAGADKVAAIEAGAADYVCRGNGYVQRLGDAILSQRHLAAGDERLAEAERHYHDILEASGDGIFVLVDNVFRFINSSLATTLGRRPQELIDSCTLLEFVLPKSRREVAEALNRVAARSGAHDVVEMCLQCPDEVTRCFDVACAASVIGGRRAVVGVARDITALKALQQEVAQSRKRAAQVERLRTLGELSAGVAHDFNNALGAILGRIALARDKAQRGRPVVDDLAVIENAARNAAAVVQRIQDFARPSGREIWEEVDLGAVLRDASEFIRTHVPDGVTLVVEIEPTPSVLGNGAELREVMLNLLRNAIDAVGEHGTVALRSFTDGGQGVVVVEDNGCGMPPEVQAHVFEPFFSTKADTGTGLGLSVSHWILRRHDARVELDSSPGNGTRFRLVFASQPSQGAVKSPRVDKNSLAIVVVDDDTTVAEMVRDLLQEQGHQVTVVAGADALWKALEAQSADLVITDLDLAEMSGWTVAREVRSQYPDTMVGLMTGWPLDASDAELHSRGVDFSLAKPFTIEALHAALAKTRTG